MQHLLVLCSQTSLIVLGLAAPENSAPAASTSEGPAQPLSQEFVVYDTELRFPTDNVAMNSIVSTKAGRVFMCGLSDGHLYEMQYQATEGWFGGKSSLHNHSVSGVTSFLPSIFSSASSGKPLTSHIMYCGLIRGSSRFRHPIGIGRIERSFICSHLSEHHHRLQRIWNCYGPPPATWCRR